MKLRQSIAYYLLSSYRRKLLDQLLFKYSYLYQGVVLDIGGRDRGNFKSPRGNVERWIIADIEKNRNPDIILDVCNMSNIMNESIDTINTLELFEHVEDPEKGLRECFRVLKNNGRMIVSMPFLYPIHSDPYDFQRWTEKKWDQELKKTGFKTWNILPMGGFFSVLADMLKAINTSLGPIKYAGFLSYPILDTIAYLDKLSPLIQHRKFRVYTTGYFIIAHK